jgi:hypothetical protein
MVQRYKAIAHNENHGITQPKAQLLDRFRICVKGKE